MKYICREHGVSEATFYNWNNVQIWKPEMIQTEVLVDVCEKDNDRYPYGFNGQTKDNEWDGVGNFMDYKEPGQDTRIGKFLAVDPMTNKFPMLTPYQFASNTPIQAIDLDGAEAVVVTGSGGMFLGLAGMEAGAGLALTPTGISFVTTGTFKVGLGAMIAAGVNFTFYPNVTDISELQGEGFGISGNVGMMANWSGSIDYSSGKWGATMISTFAVRRIWFERFSYCQFYVIQCTSN